MSAMTPPATIPKRNIRCRRLSVPIADHRRVHGSLRSGHDGGGHAASRVRVGRNVLPATHALRISTPGSINRQWSTSLGHQSVTILTANQTPAGQLNEIQAVIQESLVGLDRRFRHFAHAVIARHAAANIRRRPLARPRTESIPFASIRMIRDSPSAFWHSRASFRRTRSASSSLPPARPPLSSARSWMRMFSCCPAMPTRHSPLPRRSPANPNAYDLESIVTHELGHSFGFNHSGVWSAMMFPFAPPPGQFTGTRPTAQSPDAPLSDDDRTGLRVLYPNPSDSVHVGTISGHVLPANPLALPISPAGVTGIFPAQVVAVDNATGTVTAAVMAGWSCGDPGPAQFDGTFSLQRLTVGTSQSYQIYAEPLDGPVVLGNVIYNLTSLCRNSSTDPGWPAQYACTVPASAAPFSARIRPGP